MSSENELLRKLYIEKDTDYANILNRVSDAIVALDKEWRYTFVNEQAAALFGRSPEDLVGKHIWTEFPEAIGQPFHLNYEKAMREQAPLCFEDYYAPWDRWFENRVYPSPDGISIFFHEITARKKSEEQLSASNQLLQTIINTAPVRVFWKNKELQYLGCNNAFANDAGFKSPEDIIGKDDFQLGWKEQAELYRADDRRTIASGLPKLSYEEPQSTPDGGLIWLRTSKVPLRNDANIVIGILGIYEDITDYKLAEAERQKICNRYQHLVDNALDGIFTMDPQGNFLFVNTAICSMLGYTRDEMLSLSIFATYLQENQNEGRQRLAHFDNNESIQFERIIKRKDGSTITIEASGWKDANGNIEAIVRDITERKLAEQSLFQYADIVNNMQVGLYVYHLENLEDDRSLRLVAANPRSAGLLGLTERDIVGSTIDEIFPALRKTGIPEKFANVVRSGLPIYVEEFLYSDQNIQEACFAFKVFPLPDNRVGVLFEDITKRKNAEKALQEINKDLEQRVDQRTVELKELNRELQAFNYSISHDMRAPLIRIKGYANVLFDTCAPKLSADELQYISRLKTASKQVDEHIEALLKLYQINRGDFYIEPVNISDLSLTILNGLQEIEPDRQVAYTVADGMVVYADKVLMKEFLDKLISNAWKYTSKKADAIIEIGVTEQDRRTVYFVRDNGIGFNMDSIDNIFTPFLRLHKEDTGLGIGLASVQRIIRLHGGKIWAEANENEGAVFYFTMQ